MLRFFAEGSCKGFVARCAFCHLEPSLELTSSLYLVWCSSSQQRQHVSLTSPAVKLLEKPCPVAFPLAAVMAAFICLTNALAPSKYARQL